MRFSCCVHVKVPAVLLNWGLTPVHLQVCEEAFMSACQQLWSCVKLDFLMHIGSSTDCCGLALAWVWGWLSRQQDFTFWLGILGRKPVSLCMACAVPSLSLWLNPVGVGMVQWGSSCSHWFLAVLEHFHLSNRVRPLQFSKSAKTLFNPFYPIYFSDLFWNHAFDHHWQVCSDNHLCFPLQLWWPRRNHLLL